LLAVAVDVGYVLAISVQFAVAYVFDVNASASDGKPELRYIVIFAVGGVSAPVVKEVLFRGSYWGTDRSGCFRGTFRGSSCGSVR
jgi:hypothetical protein